MIVSLSRFFLELHTKSSINPDIHYIIIVRKTATEASGMTSVAL